jgi:hypothetical protein
MAAVKIWPNGEWADELCALGYLGGVTRRRVIASDRRPAPMAILSEPAGGKPGGPRCPRGSILAEVEGADRVLAQGVLQELVVARGAQVEPKAFVQRGGKIFGEEGLVSLKDLSDGFHRIFIEVILLDLRRVEAGEGLDLDHVTAVPRSAQVLSTEIAREVDHQRFIPQVDEPVIESGRG